ncbi:MAG: tetratricopeptide repeat protein [Niameybacter sp.]
MDMTQLGELAYEDGKYLKALNYFLQAYAEDHDTYTRLNIALCYQALNNKAQAFSTYEAIIDEDPDEAMAYYGIASLYDDDENYEMAIAHYQKAIEVDPFYDRAYFFLANAYDILGETHKAVETYKTLLEMMPEDFWALTNLGSIYETQGMIDFAHQMFKRALALEPNHGVALFNMGVIMSKLNRFNDAIHYYKHALTQDTSYSYTYLNLAVLYKEQGQIEMGLKVLNEGINHIEEEEGFLFYNRACFHALLGHTEESQSDLQEAIKLNVGFLEYAKKDPDLNSILSLS